METFDELLKSFESYLILERNKRPEQIESYNHVLNDFKLFCELEEVKEIKL